MIELWTTGWLEATPHKVVSPVSELGPRRSIVLFQAHDDLVRVHALRATHLSAAHQQETPSKTDEQLQGAPLRPHLPRKSTTRSCRKRKEASHGNLRRDSFLEWVLQHPETVLRKYRPTTQGAWVKKNEFRAKATLLKSVDR